MAVIKSNIHFMKKYVEIDGHKNGLFIESTDITNPILLFLHGGPGFPQYSMIKQSGLKWEDDFTVCYWEQRGTGMSYNSNTQGELTLERFITDTLEITNYLKLKFKKEKIYICGHSWGTLLGSVVASLHPQHFHAYIGIGQLGRHFESNKHTYDFLLESAIKIEDRKAEKDIRSVTFNEDFYKSKDYRRILGRYLNKFGGGTKRNNYTQWQGMKEIFTCKAYSWKERLNIPKGSFATYDALCETMAKVDTALLAPRFEIPIFIIHGIYDYQTSHKEAKRFFEKVEAPLKKFYTFENCAHSPFVENKEKFNHILKNDVLGA